MRRLIYVVLGVVMGFVIGSAAIAGINYWNIGRPPVGPHPHVAFLRLATGTGSDKIDFTELNGRDWSWLCLYGADQRPLESMKTRLAERREDYPIAPEIAALFGGERGPASLGPDEGALGVVDPQGYVSLVRFGGLPAVAALKAPVCREPADPVVALPAR